MTEISQQIKNGANPKMCTGKTLTWPQESLEMLGR